MALLGAGLGAEVRAIPGPQMGAAARQAVLDGAELVVAGGGDGTINAVAGALAGSDTMLGVLPLGTFNHFARDLGVPNDLPTAAASLARAEPLAVDVAEVNGHRFVNNSCLGYYPQVVRERSEPRRRTRLGKALVSLTAAVRLAGRFEPARCEVHVDGETARHRTPFLFVSNNPAEMHLFRFGRRDRLDTGKLLVCVHHSSRRRDIVATLIAGLWRDVLAGDRFDHWLTDHAEVVFRRDRPVPVFLDGELLHLTPPLRYRSLPGRLLVAAPPAATSSSSPAPARSRPGAAPTPGPAAPRRPRGAPAAG
jgi:diacylglycerol kinase family enzyme